jgi:F-type H+-transporting ATPase subunit b
MPLRPTLGALAAALILAFSAAAAAQHPEGAPRAMHRAHAAATPGPGGHEASHAGAGHAAAGHGAPSVNWFDVKPEPGEEQPFLAMLFNFLVLLLLLGRFALPPLREHLRSRHGAIRDALSEAQALRREAAARLAEVEARLAAIDSEIANVLSGIVRAAEAERERILQAAEAQAARVREEAESTLAQDLARYRRDLEREAAGAAVAAAEKIIRERMTPADQRAFVERYLAELRPEDPSTPGGTATGRGAA